MEIDNFRNMDQTMRAISLETGTLSNLVNTAKNLFPDLLHNFKKSISKVSETKAIPVEITKEQKDLLNFLKNKSYVEYMGQKVGVSEGLNSDFLTALSVSKDALKEASNLINVDLMTFRSYVSSFVTNKDRKNSLQDNTKTNKLTEIKIQNINDTMGKLYLSDSHVSEREIKHVISRAYDFEKIFAESNQVKKLLNELDIPKLKSMMEDIESLIEMIIKMVNENKVSIISPEALNNLAIGTETAAKAAETISVTYFRVLGIVTAIDNLPQSFK